MVTLIEYYSRRFLTVLRKSDVNEWLEKNNMLGHHYNRKGQLVVISK